MKYLFILLVMISALLVFSGISVGAGEDDLHSLTVRVEKDNKLPVFIHIWETKGDGYPKIENSETVLQFSEAGEKTLALSQGNYKFRLEYSNSVPGPTEQGGEVWSHHLDGLKIDSQATLTYTFMTYVLETEKGSRPGNGLHTVKLQKEVGLPSGLPGVEDGNVFVLYPGYGYLSENSDIRKLQLGTQDDVLEAKALEKSDFVSLTIVPEFFERNIGPLFLRVRDLGRRVPEKRLMLLGPSPAELSLPRGQYDVWVSDKISLDGHLAVELEADATLTLTYGAVATVSVMPPYDGMPHGELYGLYSAKFQSQGEAKDIIPVRTSDYMEPDKAE